MHRPCSAPKATIAGTVSLPTAGCLLLVLASRESLLSSGFVITAPVPDARSFRQPSRQSSPTSVVPDLIGSRSCRRRCRQALPELHEASEPGHSGVGARTGRKSRLTSKTCQAATSSGLTDEKTGARGEGGAASSRTVVAAASASAVSIADVIEHEPTDHNGECTREHKRGVVAASSSADVQIGFESPLENAQGAPNAAEGEEGGSMYGNFESGAAAPGLWEGDTGAPWTEFEDWLLQDTFSRYVIGSGRHVLWRRMVREVPELMGRNPQEARQRWLRLTGRLDAHAERPAGIPSLNSFYLQPPVLEEWEEVAEGNGMGSFKGNVFGQKGLADGTAMTTAPVDAAGKRIQEQYVETQCGVVYELGERRRTDLVGQVQSKFLEISPVTGLALATAFYALTLLSHHVQVEVFVI